MKRPLESNQLSLLAAPTRRETPTIQPVVFTINGDRMHPGDRWPVTIDGTTYEFYSDPHNAGNDSYGPVGGWIKTGYYLRATHPNSRRLILPKGVTWEDRTS
ncbi:MAG TPA: hypothetical protein VLB73_01940 [Patescibacteria group bacterium]|nr:hypothetical protein [Patescibacteria group bacterium]